MTIKELLEAIIPEKDEKKKNEIMDGALYALNSGHEVRGIIDGVTITLKIQK